MPNYSDQTISEALDRIGRRYYVLPAIQRQFIWGPNQICALFDSIMRDYPISSLLYWRVDRESADRYRWYDFVLDYHELDCPDCPPLGGLPAEERIAVLDGQQRLTALNIGLRGSHAERARYRRVGRPESYPQKRLYLDICAEPRAADDRDESLVYRFAFLEDDEASIRNSAVSAGDGTRLESCHWFRVGEILDFPAGGEGGLAINRYLQRRGLAEHPNAYPALFRLWNAIFEQKHISFYTETDQELDRVLDIFIRVNSQGEPLTKSDLLMSIATAQWTNRDAREEIPAVVRQLNAIPPGFAFSRDNLLKAGLVLGDISNVGFTAGTFNRANMERLEAQWDEIASSMYRAVEFLGKIGLSKESVRAPSVVIPVAFYLHRRALGDSYLTSTAHSEDRIRLRDWTIRALLRPGVFGSGLDTLLGRLRRAISEHGSDSFPSLEIERAMAELGKSLRFDEGIVDGLVDVRYGRADVVPLLLILYGQINTGTAFHVDHIFPQALLRPGRLRDAGYAEADIERITKECRDGLANLQLLPGGENIGKGEMLPLDWASAQFDGDGLSGYLAQNDMTDLPAGVDGFLAFFDQRRERLRGRLVRTLGSEPGSLRVPDPPGDATPERRLEPPTVGL